MLTPEAFKELFLSGSVADGHITTPSLCGRVMHGKTETDFERLASAKDVAWIFGHNELLSMMGKSGHQILRSVGFLDRAVKLKLAQGNRYRLVVFPQVEAHVATWEGVFKVRFFLHCHYASNTFLAR